MQASYNILYVNDPARSRRFYADLLGRDPVGESDNFVLFILDNEAKLGLWRHGDVSPTANRPGGFELGFPVRAREEVDHVAADWQERGIEILQAPTEMDFGRTFTGLDPDGHRLRVLYVDAG